MAFIFGNPNLFVMGTVDQTFYDPATGDVIGYDQVATDVAANYTFDLTDINGFRQSLVMSISQNTRLTGTYTSSAFSLEQRALLSGGDYGYSAVARVCETVTPSGTTLTVTGNPTKFYAQPASDTTGWAYVHKVGDATYEGVNYGIDLTTKTVQGFTATPGEQYQVTYFTQVADAQYATLAAAANPGVVTVHQRWGVYAAQNGSRSNGTLQGYLHFVVPLAMLEGDAGMDGNQTTNTTTAYNWRALEKTDNLPVCDACTQDGSNLAYYIYVPCGGGNESVQALVVPGGAISVAQGSTAQIPVKYVMPDNSLVQPTYSDLDYESDTTAVATVSNAGVVSGATAGSAEVTITLTKADDTTLTTYCNVVVTSE